jgi:hypothetical protein
MAGFETSTEGLGNLGRNRHGYYRQVRERAVTDPRNVTHKEIDVEEVSRDSVSKPATRRLVAVPTPPAPMLRGGLKYSNS